MKEILRYLSKFLDIVARPIRQMPVLFTFTLTVHALIMLIGIFMPLGSDVFLSSLLPIFDGYLVCLTAWLLRRIHLQWIPVTLFCIIDACDIFCALFYGSFININIVRLVLQTNPSESLEFLSSIIHSRAIWLTIAALLGSTWIAWCIVRALRICRHRVLSLSVYTITLLAIWSATRQVPAYIQCIKCFSATDVTDFGTADYLPDLDTPLIRTLYSTAFNLTEKKELAILLETQLQVQTEACHHTCPTIVWIIGESFSKYQTPLYNHNALPVNPNLSRLCQEGRLIIYTNAVTVSNMTAKVMKSVFSTWYEGCPDSWQSHPLFPVLFRKSVYSVYYLTNQFALNDNDFWNGLGGSFLNNEKFSQELFTYRNESLYQYDMDVLGQLPSLAYEETTDKLVIFHLMGQHVEYNKRYPESFDVFKPSDFIPEYGGDKEQRIKAEYANATLYNDCVVDSIWRIYKDQDAIMLYTADHGEEVYDWRNFHERTDETRINKQVAQYQFEIPFMILMTEQFELNHKSISEAVRNNANNPIQISDISHTILGLAGIKSIHYSSSHDILSPDYNIHKQRLIGPSTDYDQLLK